MVQSEVIKVSNLDLTFETNDGPVHALKNVDLKGCGFHFPGSCLT